MKETYRLTWEMVNAHDLYRSSNADPTFYKNTMQTVPNSEIPDEYWDSMKRVTDNPWDQYNTLKKWATQDRGFVRNVRLYAAEVPDELPWREVTDR